LRDRALCESEFKSELNIFSGLIYLFVAGKNIILKRFFIRRPKCKHKINFIDFYFISKLNIETVSSEKRKKVLTFAQDIDVIINSTILLSIEIKLN
jgi:hypothetical protein